jgi:hypothetical protein
LHAPPNTIAAFWLPFGPSSPVRKLAIGVAHVEAFCRVGLPAFEVSAAAEKLTRVNFGCR